MRRYKQIPPNNPGPLPQGTAPDTPGTVSRLPWGPGLGPTAVCPPSRVLVLRSRSNENTSRAAVDTESGLLCKAMAVAPRVRSANNQRLLESLTQAMITWRAQ